MPRQKAIVMGGTDAATLRLYAHRKAAQDREPYRVFSAKQRGLKKSAGYAVIYVDPTTAEREMIMEGLDRDTAKDFRALLETAWVYGRISAMTD